MFTFIEFFFPALKEPAASSRELSTSGSKFASADEGCRAIGWFAYIPSKVFKRPLSKIEAIFFWIVVSLSVVRIWLAYNTPVYVIVDSAHDDAYYRDVAVSILNGEWLGTYSQYTLMKGITYALFYVACIATRIPYTVLLILVHIVSALVFVGAIRSLLKFRYAEYLLYLVLIFSPVTFSHLLSQKLYRNALVVPLVLLILAGVIGLYLNLDEKKSARRYSVLAGVSLFLFWNLREDATWIMPFVICAGAISFMFAAVSCWKTRDGGSLARKTALIVLPLVILCAGNLLICSINYSYYGVFLRNDRTEGAFSDVVGLFIQIDYEEDDPEIDEGSSCYMTYEKFEYIIDHSESLTQYKDVLLQAYNTWATSIFSGEYVLGDHIQWAFRLGLQNAGLYTDAAETQAYLQQVEEELEQGISDGELQIKDGIFLSSSSKMLELSEIPEYLVKIATEYAPKIILYSNLNASAVTSTGDEDVIRDWEWRLNSYVLYPEELGDRLAFASKIVAFENEIVAMYQATALPLFIVAAASFLVLTVLQVPNIKRGDKGLFDCWIVSCGVLLSGFLSLFVFALFTWREGHSVAFYCSGAFCLLQIFEMITICCAFSLIIDFLKREKGTAVKPSRGGEE